MELTADREALLSVLTPAAACAGRVGPERHVVVRVTGDTLSAESTDTEIAITASATVTVTKPGELAVDASDLLRAVRSAPSSVIHVARVTGNKLRIKAAGAVTTMPCVDEWPTLPAREAGEGVTVPCVELARMLRQTATAADASVARVGLNGIFLESFTDKDDTQILRLVATDGHRLHRSWTPVSGFKTVAGQLLPPAAALALAKMLPNHGDATLAIGRGWGRVTFGDASFGFRMIDGEFPDYLAIMPVDHQFSTRVDVTDLTAAIRRSEVAKPRTGTVATRVEFTADAFGIHRREGEGRTYAEDVPAVLEGKPMTIGVDVDYLREAIDLVQCDTATISGSHPLSPMLIHDTGSFDAVIMPMRLE